MTCGVDDHSSVFGRRKACTKSPKAPGFWPNSTCQVYDEAFLATLRSRVTAMFERQPTLTGQLLRLRPLVEADHDGLYRVAADPLIWAQHPDPSRAQPPGFKIFFDKALESGGALAVIDRAEQKIIGTSRYHRITSDDVMIGYTFLARAYWGRGLGTEVAGAEASFLDVAQSELRSGVFDLGQSLERVRGRHLGLLGTKSKKKEGTLTGSAIDGGDQPRKYRCGENGIGATRIGCRLPRTSANTSWCGSAWLPAR